MQKDKKSVAREEKGKGDVFMLFIKTRDKD
jgi:hypothetical protein